MNFLSSPTNAIVITDTEEHTGNFYKVGILADCKVDLLVSDFISENGDPTVDVITLEATAGDAPFEGLLITSVELKAPNNPNKPVGAVIAYSY